MNNERRKLLLWMDLFGSSQCADPSFMGRVDPAAYFQPEDYVPKDQLVESLAELNLPDVMNFMSGHQKSTEIEEDPDVAEALKLMREAPNTKHGDRADRRTATASHEETKSRKMESYDEDATLDGRTVVSPLLNASNFTGLTNDKGTAPEGDEMMTCTPIDAAQNLRFAKEQLVDRLFGRQEAAGQTEIMPETADNQIEEPDDVGEASDTAAQGSVEDEEEVYQASADQDRGLLTDIPLVLGPNEIEALPMIISSGVVDVFASKNPEGINENMQSIRCNILISQESGRNLLRELLIFIAAWDLADDEVYFKLMVQIMEAILINGLVPYTYQSFAE